MSDRGDIPELQLADVEKLFSATLDLFCENVYKVFYDPGFCGYVERDRLAAAKGRFYSNIIENVNAEVREALSIESLAKSRFFHYTASMGPNLAAAINFAIQEENKAHTRGDFALRKGYFFDM